MLKLWTREIELRDGRREVERGALSPEFVSGLTSKRTSAFSDTTSTSTEVQTDHMLAIASL